MLKIDTITLFWGLNRLVVRAARVYILVKLGFWRLEPEGQNFEGHYLHLAGSVYPLPRHTPNI